MVLSKIWIDKEDSIRPWIFLGPFEDLPFKYEELLFQRHYEGEIFEYSNKKFYWTLDRRRDKYLVWGKVGKFNKALFLSNILIPERLGPYIFRITTLSNNLKFIINVNGSLNYEKDFLDIKRNDCGYFEYYFELNLNEIENILNICIINLRYPFHLGFMMEPVNLPINIKIPINHDIPFKLRERVEEEFENIRLEKDIFYPKDNIDLISDISINCKISLYSENGEKIKDKIVTNKNKINICKGEELRDGKYYLECIWEDEKSNFITKKIFSFIKLTPIEPLKGKENFEKRKRIVLDYFSNHPINGRDEIWSQVARYSLNLEINEDVIKRACEMIKVRRDCSDFILQAILRLMYWEKKYSKLSSKIKDYMKETILGFKYWVDEPGETTMYMDTENHRLLFHTAEWLAGQLFPTEEFTNSLQKGLYHSLKGRMYIMEWLRERLHYGFDEWHSNSYYPIVITALLNIYDFAPIEEYKLRMLAKQLLDYMFFIFAEDTYHGVFGTTHGRCYSIPIKYPDCDESSSLCWLLYGEGNLFGGGMAPISLATSEYKIPEIIFKIAHDNSQIVESLQRHGIITQRKLSANFIIYKTPDYMISGLQDFQKGDYFNLYKEAQILRTGSAMFWSFPYPQIHVAQVTLQNKTVIIWSCPLTSNEECGLRPDYWAGNVTLPRVIQFKNILVLIWRLNKFSYMTHCLFESYKFDEIVQEGKWIFGRVNDGYVGIYSHNGMVFENNGQYAKRELICYSPENTWIVECGRKEDWGSFDKFVLALKNSKILEKDGNILYESPSRGKLIVGWDIDPTINGEKIKLKNYPLLDSPYGYSEFGSGKIKINYKGEEFEIMF